MTINSSRLDFDRRSDPHKFPDFVHFFICDRDTTICPVMQHMRFSHPRVFFWKSVQHDVTTWTRPKLLGCRKVSCVWVRNMERLIEVAVGVSLIEYVGTFWRPVIALTSLWSDWFAA